MSVVFIPARRPESATWAMIRQKQSRTGGLLGRYVMRSGSHHYGRGSAVRPPLSCSGGTLVVRVALFITCFNDTLFPETGRATVGVLERLGHEVEFPIEQTCCGQMHFNTGYQRETIPLVRRFVEVFSPYEAVVAPSGSCVGMVRELYPMAAEVANDEPLGRRIEELAPKVFELSEFLVKKLEVTDVGAYYPHRVTYHPTCHSLRMLGVGDAPLELLRAVRGIDLVQLTEAKECCGFGGKIG